MLVALVLRENLHVVQLLVDVVHGALADHHVGRHVVSGDIPQNGRQRTRRDEGRRALVDLQHHALLRLADGVAHAQTALEVSVDREGLAGEDLAVQAEELPKMNYGLHEYLSTEVSYMMEVISAWVARSSRLWASVMVMNSVGTMSNSYTLSDMVIEKVVFSKEYFE